MDDQHLAERSQYESLRRTIAAQVPPPGFRVTALMTCFNEADILDDVIGELAAQGVGVHVIDNWSSDDSYAVAEARKGRGVVGLERFPADGASSTYDWARLLRRVEQLAQELDSDWYLHHDCDEIRESPWPDIGLRQALYGIGELGYNAIDHTMLNFAPVDDAWQRGASLRQHFTHFAFGTRPGHFLRVNGWSRQPDGIDISSSGGHDVLFSGRRVFPFKFLLRHYAIRSQAHGERKVFRERQARWNPEERSRGWHGHYDGFAPGATFIRRPAELVTFDHSFYERYFLERLGLRR